jgi:hypothetical protein
MPRILGSETHIVFRYPETTFVNGVAQRGTPTRFDVQGSLQPISAKEMSLNPELVRTSARYYLFTTTRLITASEAGQRPADRVCDPGGDTWEVTGVEDWSRHRTGLPHYRVTLSDVGLDEGNV